MHTCAIVNPVAGGGAVRQQWPTLLPRLLAVSNRLTVRWTNTRGDATCITRRALREGCDRIVAVGGDGTLHEVVNGFFEDGTLIHPTAVCAQIPCGTGSDLRRSLDLPTGPDPVMRLRDAPVRPIDLLRIKHRRADGWATTHAINIASIGLSSAVVRNVNRPGPRLVGGRLRYLGAILRSLVHHRPVEVNLTLDETPLPAPVAHLIAVANGHTFGAGLRIAPAARLNDGVLDVTVLGAAPIPTLLRHAHRFYRGTHPALPFVSTYRGQRLTLEPNGPSPVWLEADGELIGRLPATIEVLPGRLQLQA